MKQTKPGRLEQNSSARLHEGECSARTRTRIGSSVFSLELQKEASFTTPPKLILANSNGDARRYTTTVLMAMRPGKLACDLIEVLPPKHRNIMIKEPVVGSIIKLEVLVYASIERKISSAIVFKSAKQKITLTIQAEILNPLVFEHMKKINHKQDVSAGRTLVRLVSTVPPVDFPRPEAIRIHLQFPPELMMGGPGGLGGPGGSAASVSDSLTPRTHEAMGTEAGGPAGGSVASSGGTSRQAERRDSVASGPTGPAPAAPSAAAAIAPAPVDLTQYGERPEGDDDYAEVALPPKPTTALVEERRPQARSVPAPQPPLSLRPRSCGEPLSLSEPIRRSPPTRLRWTRMTVWLVAWLVDGLVVGWAGLGWAGLGWAGLGWAVVSAPGRRLAGPSLLRPRVPHELISRFQEGPEEDDDYPMLLAGPVALPPAGKGPTTLTAPLQPLAPPSAGSDVLLTDLINDPAPSEGCDPSRQGEPGQSSPTPPPVFDARTRTWHFAKEEAIFPDNDEGAQPPEARYRHFNDFDLDPVTLARFVKCESDYKALGARFGLSDDKVTPEYHLRMGSLVRAVSLPNREETESHPLPGPPILA
ncbi:hypothetical protein PAPYR_3276 [Paratrimastix pyriformis]|uniref:Uncharacterized protein n=1 Tax=Paratrimastix pyriformis TaxID=342808 RepID=A0ABQ8UN88_9EUKA|nr:hypothetical protein PAPYR_3276 [Paratrimastix pyriformis]